MKRSTELSFVRSYLLLTGVVTAGIGLVLLFWPEQILQWFIPGATGDFFVRFIGSALMGYAALNFLTAQTKDRVAQKIALWANLVTLVIATGLSLYGVASNMITQRGWLIITEHVVFVAGFALCLYIEYKTPRS